MKRQLGIDLQRAGMLIIVIVMILDRFVFSIHTKFILFCAVLSATLLIWGIQIIKREEAKALGLFPLIKQEERE